MLFHSLLQMEAKNSSPKTNEQTAEFMSFLSEFESTNRL